MLRSLHTILPERDGLTFKLVRTRDFPGTNTLKWRTDSFLFFWNLLIRNNDISIYIFYFNRYNLWRHLHANKTCVWVWRLQFMQNKATEPPPNPLPPLWLPIPSKYYTVIDWLLGQQQFCLTRGRICCLKLLLSKKPVYNCFVIHLHCYTPSLTYIH